MKKYILLLILPFIGFTQELNDWEINEMLKEIANELNRDCPMIVDESTTLKNITSLGKTLIYNYSIDNSSLVAYDVTKSEFLAFQKEVITNAFCTDPSMNIYRENHINVIWKYSDLMGKYIGEIKLNKNDCN